MFTFLTFISNAQNTYTWNVATGDWGVATNWTPSRTTPATNDILVFNGSTVASAAVTNITKDSIGRLRFINNSNVTFSTAIGTAGNGTIARTLTAVSGTGTNFLSQFVLGDQLYTTSAASGTEVSAITTNVDLVTAASGTIAASTTYSIYPRLTISGGASPAFEVQSGASLTINCTSPGLTIFIGAGSVANVYGTITVGTGRSRILANDSLGFVFKAGSILNNSNVTGNIFTAVGLTNRISFDSTAVLVFSGTGSNPFGLTAPDSKVLFKHSSIYRHQTTGAPSLSGRTFGSLEINLSTFNQTSISTAAGLTIDNLILTSATAMGFSNTSNGTINIGGDIIINSGALSFGNTSTGTQNVVLNGTGLQNITGTGGSIYFGPLSTLTTNNSAGFLLNRSFQIEGPLTMSSGNINLNSDTITLGSAVTPSALTRTSGSFIGAGLVTRWIGAGSIPIGTDAGLFPMGTATANRSLWIAGTPTTAGTVSVSHNDVAGNSTFGTPFSDNATNAVSVNVRQNSNWVVSTANSFAGTGLSLRVQGTGTATQVTNTTNLRLTLATSVAPGTAADGGGTSLLPQANRTGLTAANLSNTFYIGGNATQNPLPINLINFNAINTSPSVTLVWQSSKELNADKYEVEKSINGLSFETISSIKAKGNASIENNYSFVDEDAFKNNNIVYYRLKMIDMSSSLQYSSVVPVKKSDVKNTINIVNVTPNPSIKEININIFATNAQQSKVEIIDIRGTVIYSAEKTLIKGDNTFNLDTNFMSAGIYFIRLTGDKEVKHFRIIKN